MKYSLKALFFLPLLALAFSCSPKDEATAPPDEGSEASASSNELAMSAEQMRLAGIELGLPGRSLLPASLSCDGSLVLTPEQEAQVDAAIGGFVRQVHVRPGQEVAQGQALATVMSNELVDLQLDYLSALSQEKLAKAEELRQQRLHEQQATAERELQAVRAEREQASARRAAAERKLAMLGIDPGSLTPESLRGELVWRSPIAGQVGQVEALPGQFLAAGARVADVVSGTSTWARLNVFEQDLALVREGQAVALQAQSGPDSFAGTVASVGRSKSPETGAFAVMVRLAEAVPGLGSGAFVRGSITLSSDSALVLPSAAVVRLDGQPQVFSELAEGRFVPVPVRLGSEQGGWVQLLDAEPLQGRRVVLQGANYLKAEWEEAQE